MFWINNFLFFGRFVAISDLYEPTDDGTESQVGLFVFILDSHEKLLQEL